jgi:hypothetical protein
MREGQEALGLERARGGGVEAEGGRGGLARLLPHGLARQPGYFPTSAYHGWRAGNLPLMLEARVVEDGVARWDLLQVPAAAAAAFAVLVGGGGAALLLSEGEEQRAALEELDGGVPCACVVVRSEATDGGAGRCEAIPQPCKVCHGPGGMDIAVADENECGAQELRQGSYSAAKHLRSRIAYKGKEHVHG